MIVCFYFIANTQNDTRTQNSAFTSTRRRNCLLQIIAWQIFFVECRRYKPNARAMPFQQRNKCFLVTNHLQRAKHWFQAFQRWTTWIQTGKWQRRLLVCTKASISPRNGRFFLLKKTCKLYCNPLACVYTLCITYLLTLYIQNGQGFARTTTNNFCRSGFAGFQLKRSVA